MNNRCGGQRKEAVKKSALVTFAVIAIVASFAQQRCRRRPAPTMGFLFAFRNPECSEGALPGRV